METHENNPEENNDLLDRSLREWRVNAPMPPWFQGQVWRRIADAAKDEKAAIWMVLQDWFQFAFSRPSIALAYVLVLLFVGSGTGYWQARERSVWIDHALGSRYVQSVDPYQKAGK